jgi:hypothetical protein
MINNHPTKIFIIFKVHIMRYISGERVRTSGKNSLYVESVRKDIDHRLNQRGLIFYFFLERISTLTQCKLNENSDSYSLLTLCKLNVFLGRLTLGEKFGNMPCLFILK